ncbi:protein kinase domain-containing protein [Chondromyces crocatus]|uniref:Protein kinase n=1 Tax=Chondromyces crocatus TaxID=52 RepID=A0A0K1EBU9_CHOCO|nr:protein kinase [Chondromyces crocatus]AKT38147.1 protein kinase [Chondromyces crocatus]
MRDGRILGGRFEILRPVGAGSGYRLFEAREVRDARDAIPAKGSERIAIKLLPSNEHSAERQSREVQALAGLNHPGVARYVAHGASEAGEPWIATTWLDGETLASRLAKRPLQVPEALSLGARVAVALGAVHRAGVVHRDLKPTNILLTEGSLERPVILDFGVARVPGAAARPARQGTVIGTPGYAAPEQARNEPDVDARADVFSLGCVLFRCLTGKEPFHGENALALTLKVLLEEPKRTRDLHPGIPVELDALVARMLSKARQLRPRDGDAVAVELEGLGAPASAARIGWRAPPAEPALVLTANERRLMSLVLVRDAASSSKSPHDGPVSSRRSREADAARRTRALRAAAERHQGRLESLADGALLVVMTSNEAPTDLVSRAARCALAIRAVLEGAPVSLVTGRAEIEARLPVGELIDRAVSLLTTAVDPDTASPVAIDDLTARLLGQGFDVTREGGGPALHGERDGTEPSRALLGKPTRCLGRERELAQLEAAFAYCADTPTAAAVLVTGPAGAGKSRLRHELLQRLKERGEPIEVWLGRGDPMGGGAAFGLLARAMRYALGISGEESLAERRRRIFSRLGALPAIEAQRIASFVGELIGTPFPEELSPQLKTARRDPVLMGDQIRRAAEDLLRAACASQPVILVLEDLHWGDLPTVTLLDSALRNLADQPLLVFALARPEVQKQFPKLWVGRQVEPIALGPLPRRASERLVRDVLGDAIPAHLSQAIIERSGGNALYLEELIRAVSEGQGERLPETVLAMAQARLSALDPEARRILRAASVFGDSFWTGGVEALLGGSTTAHRMDDLVARELIVRRTPVAEGSLRPTKGDGKPTEPLYAFRHEVEREAAYSMLTEADRQLGHRLAGAWLEREGKGEPIALAEHFERGDERHRAGAYFVEAAEATLRGNDLAAALRRAERGIACGATGTTLGELQLVAAEALLWRGELPRAEASAREAAQLLSRGSAAWYRALTHGATAASKQGASERLDDWIVPATEVPPLPGALSAQVVCLAFCASELVFSGRFEAAEALLERGTSLTGDPPAVDGQALGVLHQAYALRAMAGGDPGAGLAGFEAALFAFGQTGDRRNACTIQGNLGYTLSELGDFEGAEGALRAALTEAERMGLFDLAPVVRQNLGLTLAQTNQLEEARRLQQQALEAFREQGVARMQGMSHAYLARIALRAGKLAAAEHEARSAVDLLVVAPPLRAFALAVLASALLAQRRAPEALGLTGEAFAQLQAAGGLEEGESLVWRARADALAAAGELTEAEHVRAEARRRLEARAARISDPDWRERFLREVPDNTALYRD